MNAPEHNAHSLSSGHLCMWYAQLTANCERACSEFFNCSQGGTNLQLITVCSIQQEPCRHKAIKFLVIIIFIVVTKYASQSCFKTFSVIDSRGHYSKSPQEQLLSKNIIIPVENRRSRVCVMVQRWMESLSSLSRKTNPPNDDAGFGG